jgi:hypothetical protein
MKKILLITALCVSSVMVFAQNDNNHRYPPSSVQRSWQRDYPDYYNMNNNRWEWRNNRWHTTYQDRNHSNRNVDVYYDRSGHRLYAQSEWDRNDLPDRVRERIRSRYRTDNYSAYRVERPGGRIYFQVTLGGGHTVYLDERGRETRYR